MVKFDIYIYMYIYIYTYIQLVITDVHIQSYASVFVANVSFQTDCILLNRDQILDSSCSYLTVKTL